MDVHVHPESIFSNRAVTAPASTVIFEPADVQSSFTSSLTSRFKKEKVN